MEPAGVDNSAILFAYRWPSIVRGMKTPQPLSHQAIEEFKAIYQDEFGRELSDDEVQEIALRLLRCFGILQKPDHSDNQDEIATR